TIPHRLGATDAGLTINRPGVVAEPASPRCRRRGLRPVRRYWRQAYTFSSCRSGVSPAGMTEERAKPAELSPAAGDYPTIAAKGGLVNRTRFALVFIVLLRVQNLTKLLLSAKLPVMPAQWSPSSEPQAVRDDAGLSSVSPKAGPADRPGFV